MALNPNDRIAVEVFNDVVSRESLDKNTAWKAIAKLLLTCEIWEGKRSGWSPLVYERCIVFEEANTFGVTKSGEENHKVQLGKKLGAYLAAQFGVPGERICDEIGVYWRLREIRNMQPNNLLGNSFRSLCVAYLERFGNPKISYEEELSPHAEFVGHQLQGASPRAKIDIVARRGKLPVALMSCKWRYRHDRVEFIEEFMRYLTPARRLNSNMEFYAITGEFSPARLHKALEASQPASAHGPMSAVVHFAPQIVREALEINGRTAYLQGLPYLADASYKWR